MANAEPIVVGTAKVTCKSKKLVNLMLSKVLASDTKTKINYSRTLSRVNFACEDDTKCADLQLLEIKLREAAQESANLRLCLFKNNAAAN